MLKAQRQIMTSPYTGYIDEYQVNDVINFNNTSNSTCYSKGKLEEDIYNSILNELK